MPQFYGTLNAWRVFASGVPGVALLQVQPTGGTDSIYSYMSTLDPSGTTTKMRDGLGYSMRDGVSTGAIMNK